MTRIFHKGGEKILTVTALTKRGFTLIELMVVIAVIAILATIALFGLGQAQRSARDTQRQQIMNGLRAALERYMGDTSSYPAANFSNVMTILTGGGQLAGLPTDPGCGAGKVLESAGPFTNGNWVPCGIGSGVTYSFTTAAGTYTLLLTREGGGSNSFVSPQ